MTEPDVPVTVLVVPAPADVAATSTMLRASVTRSRAAVLDEPARTWAIIGELLTAEALSENERVVEHDRLGRLAVRLAVDKTLCVGDSRAVRALYQGAVMEGSWGDEVRIVADPDEIAAVLGDDDWTPMPGDTVLIAGIDPLATGLTGAIPTADITIEESSE